MEKKIIIRMLAALLLTASAVYAQEDYNKPPQIKLTEQQLQLVEGNNDFAFRLFRQVCGNMSTVISPLSITYDLGMLNNGAAGQTQQEINEVLGFGQAGADGINQFCRKMHTECPLLDEQTQVMISNAIFLNEPHCLLPEFLKKAQDYYDATCETRNFADGQTMDVINQWGSEHTMGMIPRIFDENSFNPMATSYLLNAVYFKGTWTLKFDKDQTRDESFGGGEPVPMMHMHKQLPYTENDDCQMLSLPYGNRAYQMTVLLPREGKTIADVLATLDAQRWTGYQWLPMEEVDVKLPRFETTTKVNLVKPMSALGMPTAFDPQKADIPYYCNMPQYISNMFQAAKIRVDEEGTEAAAITTIEVCTTSFEEPRVYQFHANRPFLYIISEQSTGVIFFIGQYTGDNSSSADPSAVDTPHTAKTLPTDLHDLSGRRMNSLPARGLYINEGRKVIR